MITQSRMDGSVKVRKLSGKINAVRTARNSTELAREKPLRSKGPRGFLSERGIRPQKAMSDSGSCIRKTLVDKMWIKCGRSESLFCLYKSTHFLHNFYAKKAWHLARLFFVSLKIFLFQ